GPSRRERAVPVVPAGGRGDVLGRGVAAPLRPRHPAGPRAAAGRPALRPPRDRPGRGPGLRPQARGRRRLALAGRRPRGRPPRPAARTRPGHPRTHRRPTGAPVRPPMTSTAPATTLTPAETSRLAHAVVDEIEKVVVGRR